MSYHESNVKINGSQINSVHCVCCRPGESTAQVEQSLVSGEEHLTLITESMSITSSDEEKLQLLNKNTELRRLNKEVLKHALSLLLIKPITNARQQLFKI